MKGNRARACGSLTAVLTMFALCVAPRAHAQAPPRKTSITISPFQLFNPIVEVTGERRLANKIGVAAIVGGGSLSENDKRYGVWEVGGQFQYYPLGSFNRGLMLGVDTGYLHAAGQLESPTASYVGARAGPFVGYRVAAKDGFTFEAQFGPLYIRASANNSEWQTLVNLKVGWSF